MKIAFLLPWLELAGGIGVVLEHARQLRRKEVDARVLYLAQPPGPWSHPALDEVPCLQADDVDEEFDVALATWCFTVYELPRVRARRKAYLVQSLEDRFFPPGTAARRFASLTYGVGLPCVTEARWIADELAAREGGGSVYLVRNGVDKEVFRQPSASGEPRAGPLRILVEGSLEAPLKGVAQAIEAVSLMRESRELTLVVREPEAAPPGPYRVLGQLDQAELAGEYARADVLLKLSAVEGMAGPPLEAFHAGATCVSTPVTGHEEYLQHGWNGLLTPWDDVASAARSLDVLARDRRLLAWLRANALETARAWPSWEQSSELMALALERIAAGPQTGSVTPALLGGLQRLWELGHEDLLAAVTAERDGLVAQVEVLGEAVVDAELSIGGLTRSRLLRLLYAAESPVRRLRPGHGSVLGRAQAIEARLKSARERGLPDAGRPTD